MYIRPIDYVTIAPKSQEASQLQHNDLRGRVHAENTAAQTFQKMEQRDSQRVVQSNKSEKENFKYDAKDGGRGGYHGGQKKKKNGKEEDKNSSSVGRNSSSGGFDIKI